MTKREIGEPERGRCHDIAQIIGRPACRAERQMSFERIARRLQEKGRSRHAGGYRWLLENYEAMIQVMTTIGPSWTAIAEEAANAGVRGVRQQVITGDSLRRTWKRVCRDMQRGAAVRVAVKAPQERPARPLPVDWTPPLADPAACPIEANPASRPSGGAVPAGRRSDPARRGTPKTPSPRAGFQTPRPASPPSDQRGIAP